METAEAMAIVCLDRLQNTFRTNASSWAPPLALSQVAQNEVQAQSLGLDHHWFESMTHGCHGRNVDFLTGYRRRCVPAEAAWHAAALYL